MDEFEKALADLKVALQDHLDAWEAIQAVRHTGQNRVELQEQLDAAGKRANAADHRLTDLVGWARRDPPLIPFTSDAD